MPATAAPAADHLPDFLRPYQREAIASADSDWATGLLRLLIVLPTGMGKTVTFTTMVAREAAAGRRTLILVHRDELITQTVKDVGRALESAGVTPDVGVVKASRNRVRAQIVVASIQTLGRSALRREQIGDVDLIVCDEAHHATASTWLATVKHLGGYAGTRVLGLTATPIRTDGLGLADVWQKVTYRRDIWYAWEHGYLHRPKVIQVREDPSPEGLVRIWLRHAGHRQGVVAVATVREAQIVAAAFNAAGVAAAVIHGETPTAERRKAYAGVVDGSVRVLVNVNVLTEGFDSPRLSVALLARPMSQGPVVQTVGRVLRLFEGDEYAPPKRDALVLDCFGALEDLATLDVEPDLSDSVPGARDEVKPTSKARKASKVSYAIRVRTGRLGLPVAVVRRIEGDRVTQIATVRGWDVQGRAKAAIKADQAKRVAALQAQIDRLTRG